LNGLNDIVQLTGRDRIISNGLPLVAGVAFLPGELKPFVSFAKFDATLLGLLITRGIENRKKSKKVGPEGDLVDAWNDVS
jgi:hypothetical protein